MVIGFIGLGDVGSRFSGGIARDGGADVLGYDLKLGQSGFQEKQERCVQCGVKLAESKQALADGSDILIAATSCAEAIETAKDYLPWLRPGQYYVDVNSAVPKIKKEIQALVEAKGAHFVDGGILDSPMNGWHRIPVALSGGQADYVADVLNSYGMNMRNVGAEVGQASSLKILRSIFTKGLEALLLETFASAYHYGVLDEVYGSIKEMLEREPFAPMFERMVTTDVIHAYRRAREVGAVADMLDDEGFDSTMSRAACNKLMWSASSGVREHFGETIPEDYRDVVRYFAALRSKEANT